MVATLYARLDVIESELLIAENVTAIHAAKQVALEYSLPPGQLTHSPARPFARSLDAGYVRAPDDFVQLNLIANR